MYVVLRIYFRVQIHVYRSAAPLIYKPVLFVYQKHKAKMERKYPEGMPPDIGRAFRKFEHPPGSSAAIGGGASAEEGR